MSSSNVGLVTRAWFRWKSLRLPWRKRFLVGSDLQGNTYWIFRLTGTDPPPLRPAANSSSSDNDKDKDNTRWRRIVKYPRSTHYSDVQVPPQWHQWLRYQRHEPPSLDEQRGELARRARIKLLAAEADARWAAKPSYLDRPPPPPSDTTTTTSSPPPPPPQNAPPPPQEEQEEDRAVRQGEGEGEVRADDGAVQKEKRTITTTKKQEEKNDPWKKAATGPGETWQPTAWSPTSSRKR